MRSSRGTEVFRLDRMGVLLPADHRLATADGVPVASLAKEPLLLADQTRAPEYCDIVLQVCKTAGFDPRRYHGSVQSVRAASDLVAQSRCVMLVPQSCDLLMPDVRWLPLTDPTVHYPWSLLWQAGHASHLVQAVLDSTRALAVKLSWITQAIAADSATPC